MAGTLTISTLSDGTNSTSATNCIQGSAKSWVNFNGQTSATIRGSYNVSSVTRLQEGSYNINFTNAMTDTNYATLVSSQTRTFSNINIATYTTSSVNVQIKVPDATLTDVAIICVAVFR